MNSVSHFVFVMDTCCVFCSAENPFLNIIKYVIWSPSKLTLVTINFCWISCILYTGHDTSVCVAHFQLRTSLADQLRFHSSLPHWNVQELTIAISQATSPIWTLKSPCYYRKLFLYCIIITYCIYRCTSNDLKMIIRLVKHDLRINAGPKHM
jgi:hypothetical protein